MLMVSISIGDASATAHAIARLVICSNSASRSAAGTVFESLSPGMCLSGCSTTAPATTGPARHPRPTSTTPHTRLNPSLRRTFSSVRVAATRVIRIVGERSDRARILRTLRGLFCALAHPGRLALAIAQEVQLGPAHFRPAHDFHLLNDRRVQQEDQLDALADRLLAHRKRGAHPDAVHADHDALEHLDTLFVALAHLDVHFHGVSGRHLRPLGHLCLLYDFNRAHGRLPSSRPSTLAGFPALLRPTPRRPADRAAAPVSAPAPAACATCVSRRDGPIPARREPSTLGTPPAACSAGNRATRVRTNHPRPNLHLRRPQESASPRRRR